MIRLVATDMDGTLLNSRKEVPSGFIEWVKKHADVLMVLASGRQYYTLLEDFSDISEEAVFLAENGAMVVYRDEIIHVDEMARSSAKLVLNRAMEIEEVCPILCGTHSVYYRKDQEDMLEPALRFFHSRMPVDSLLEAVDRDTIIKVANFVPARNADNVFPRFTGLPKNVYAVVTGPEWIDVMNVSVNKGVALKMIQNRFSILPEESMAFGDLMNDYEMLKECEYSFAMENACEGIYKVARYTTASNDEDGVMKILRNIEQYG